MNEAFKPKEHAMKEVYVGIDVHKDENVFGSAFDGRCKGELIGKCSADMNRTLTFIRRYMKNNNLTKEQMHICYEAGPTGFVLARRLIKLGFDCVVIAPSKIPERAGDKVKTDRLDACKLARLHRAGELVPVHIPNVEDEVIRDVCRGRTDAVNETKRGKQQLSSFLLRNGYRYTGKANWTEAHMRYLRELVMPERAQKMVMEEYLLRIDAATAQVGRIDNQMELLLQTWSRRPFVEALMGFRGFQTTAAMVLTAEVGDFLRFAHPKLFMGFLGMVPKENTTGNHRRQGNITKCGNSHARWMLIECAGHYRMPPKVSKALSKRQEGLSREVRALSWHAQNRLNNRWYKLMFRKVHHNKIQVAIARELSSYLWDLAHLVR
jgi:transposase